MLNHNIKYTLFAAALFALTLIMLVNNVAPASPTSITTLTTTKAHVSEITSPDIGGGCAPTYYLDAQWHRIYTNGGAAMTSDNDYSNFGFTRYQILGGVWHPTNYGVSLDTSATFTKDSLIRFEVTVVYYVGVVFGSCYGQTTASSAWSNWYSPQGNNWFYFTIGSVTVQLYMNIQSV